MPTKNDRNSNIDFLKGIAAILVVFIHVRFDGWEGKYVADIARFSVPVFFLTSGYFSFQVDYGRIKKRICHVLWLIVLAYSLNIV